MKNLLVKANLTPCHYISPGPPPRLCAYRAAAWSGVPSKM